MFAGARSINFLCPRTHNIISVTRICYHTYNLQRCSHIVYANILHHSINIIHEYTIHLKYPRDLLFELNIEEEYINWYLSIHYYGCRNVIANTEHQV